MRRFVLAILFLLGVAGPASAGVDEGDAAYDRGDYRTAAREFEAAAQRGDAHAQFNLGLLYDGGQGVPQDNAKAAKWYRKAADQGLAEAQVLLGFLYDGGRGVLPDYAEAAKWYRKAADQGFAVAQFYLGLLYAKGQGVPQDYVAAHMWFNLAAAREEQGAAKARDAVASFMTPAQIAEAQRLARAWKQNMRKENTTMPRLIPIAVSSEKLTTPVRLGRMVYWVATAISVVILLRGLSDFFFELAGGGLEGEDVKGLWAIVLVSPIIAGLVWLAGRAVRYILSGE